MTVAVAVAETVTGSTHVAATGHVGNPPHRDVPGTPLFGSYVIPKLRSQLPNNSVYGTSVRGQNLLPSTKRGKGILSHRVSTRAGVRMSEPA